MIIPRNRLACLSLLLVLTCLATPVGGQQALVPAQYPTMALLDSTVIPPRDQVDLARRLLGVTAIPARPRSAPLHQLGDQATFWVTNSAEDRDFQVGATLRAIGEHIYLWVENDAPVDDVELQRLADGFDARVYDQVRALWGSEDTPGIDGDARIYGLFARNLGSGTAAYFVREHTYPVEAVKTSNQHEMFFFNMPPAGTTLDTSSIEGVIAHEFQHMIRAHIDPNEDTWMNEGLSMFTQLYLGDASAAYAGLYFLNTPGTQLNTWAEDHNARAANYGAALLFLDYFYERYGLSAVQAAASDPANGLKAVDHALQKLGEPDVNRLFADWAVANMVFDPTLDDGRYGYHRLPTGFPSASPLQEVVQYPYSSSRPANQYSTDYYSLSNLGGKQALDITLDSPESVPLVPVPPAEGRWFWYSNRGDQSDSTLTQSFDLSGVTSATLKYQVWYYTENVWDYGYVMVSTDDGATWAPLATPHSSSDNPHHNAYGPAYTGASDGWVQESLSLDAYAGKKIQVRFEMITDDAVTQPGMVVDNVSIPEIGYASDFESNDGGWEAQGWLRTDNRLPQQTWVQVIQRVGKAVQVTRWQTSGANHWTLPLVKDVEEVVVAVSPFAPVTTVPMPYTLRVAAG